MTQFNDLTSVLSLLKTRKSGSAKSLGLPGPSAEQLAEILEIAVRVPDHGKLNPWRFIIIEGEARQKLGEQMAARWHVLHPEHGEGTLGFVRAMLMRAPLIIGVVSTAAANPKIPEWEQQLSAAAVCYNILLAATAMGFHPQWQSDWLVYDKVMLEALGVQPQEQVAGLIYIGTTTAPLEERPRPDVQSLVTHWGR
jgi:nitroreductase